MSGAGGEGGLLPVDPEEAERDALKKMVKEEKELESEKKALAQAAKEENRRLSEEASAKIKAAEERAEEAKRRKGKK